MKKFLLLFVLISLMSCEVAYSSASSKSKPSKYKIRLYSGGKIISEIIVSDYHTYRNRLQYNVKNKTHLWNGTYLIVDFK